MVDNAAPAPATGHHAPPWVWPAVTFLAKHVGSAAAVLTVLAYLATPMAQDFIKDTVDDRLKQLETQMGEVQTEQAIMGTKIENVQEVQRDTKRDTRMILQSMQGLRRDLRAE